MQTISIIIPIFNAEPFLAKCLDSLINQPYSALQIILVNDGSTDNSLAIAQRYAQQDSRITVFSQTNQGQSAARNLGLQYATGEYISFIDADDYVDADFYTARGYGEEEILPWDTIDVGVTKRFLRLERKRAYEAKVTPDCREGCAGCGANCLLKEVECDA